MTPTPGPWAYDGVRVYAPAMDETILGEQRSLIALVYAPPGSGTASANGAVVAAAPLMLKALHDVWVLAETLDIGNHERSMLRDVISAAIAAAEGGAKVVRLASGQPCGCDPAAGWTCERHREPAVTP